MKTFEIHYLNYEGETPTRTIEVEDDEDAGDAIRKAVMNDEGWGDGVKTVLSVREITGQ
jgi:hypothetical protein